MNYNWFKIFNLTEFNATGLVSRKYTLNLEGIGEKTILVTKGVAVGMTYEDVFLSLELNDKNPFEFEGHAIYVDSESNDVYLGLPVADES